ncbi:MAG: DNA polymerase III subunit alpha [Propionicimonas sp.]
MTKSFVHLHNHTDKSLLDGAQSARKMVAEAVRQGMPAIASTDHGNMHGAYDMYKLGQELDIKTIIGVEAYLAPRVHRSEKKAVRWGAGGQDDVSGAGAYTHMTMLAETTEGMHNLFRLSSRASLEGTYRKPRMDRELLNEYGKGIIASSGCASGEIQILLRQGKYDQAVASAAEFRDIFGAGNFFVEVMDHGLDIERRPMNDLLRLAKDLDLPLLATNDTHYTHQSEAETHDALLCVNSGSLLSDPQRFRFDAQEFYLKTAEQMRHMWRDHPDACDNTLLVAERCNVTFNEGANLMPRFQCPEGETESTWLVKEVNAGLHRRFPSGIPAASQAQADYEIGVIVDMGWPGYFLVTADFIRWAKNRGIRVGPGRGSGAGSTVAYVLGITDIDPKRHGLMFERFLNPERVSPPDFDVDFDDRRRGEVIQYVTEKYGSDRVCQIVTYGTIKAKNALKDSARVLGYPYGVGDKLTKAMPAAVMGKTISLAGVFNPADERYAEAADFRALHAADPDVQKIVTTAMGLEGLTRSTGVHAAGVILSAEPLLDHIPIMRREADGAIITQFDQHTCETLGLIKMDFLGLRNLTVVDDAVKNIARNQGVTIDLDDLTEDLADPKTFELLARGDTLGVFQLDGGPMRSLLRAMVPDNFEDISAVLALYRPGPMGANAHIDYADRKNGRKPVVPIHPELAVALGPILDDTYGLIVYQEQVMAIAQQLAGYTLGGADLLRRAMGKKKKEILEKEFGPFSAGMVANGFSTESIDALWAILVPFSDYAFNKAHTAAYGVISYWTAYLKANYPAEYMAALLTSVGDDKDKSAIYLNECRRMGIKVMSPDVNDSDANYSAVGTNIRVGLSAIRNVGQIVVTATLTARASKGAYTSFLDYLDKVEPSGLNKRSVDSLIKAGAFDTLGHTRCALSSIHESAVDQYAAAKRQEAHGQESLFADMDDEVMAGASVQIPDLAEWNRKLLLANERDMLGLYVSDHPLNGFNTSLQSQVEFAIGTLLESGRAGTKVSIGGLVTELTRKTTKAGDQWAVIHLEDMSGQVEVLCFNRLYQQVTHLLENDAILIIQGDVDRADDGTVKIRAESIRVPILTVGGSGAPLDLTVPEDKATVSFAQTLREVLTRNPGPSPVYVHLTSPGKNTVMELEKALWVTMSGALVGELKAQFGAACLTGGNPIPHPQALAPAA